MTEATPSVQEDKPAGHTPGPWEWSAGRTLRHLSAGATCFAQVSMPVRADYDADACLIEAAPEMLEALEAQEDRHQRGLLNMTTQEIDRVTELRRAAIAKAKGASRALGEQA